MNLKNWIRNLLGQQKPAVAQHEVPGDLVTYFAALAGDGKFPGLAAGLEKQGRSVLFEGFGYADLENKIPVDPEHSLFRAASISKPITSLGVMRMIDKGMLRLDAPVGDYLPSLPADKAALTLRQLLSHTAGIRSYKGKEFALNRNLSVEEGLELFIDDPLLYTPGTDYHYTSFDFVLIAAIMEQVSHKNFESLIRELVFRPLGMDTARSENPSNPDSDTVKFYSHAASGFKSAPEVDNRYKLAGGGFILTVADVLKLGQAVLDKALVADAIWEEFLSPVYVQGNSTYYGLGWEVSRDEDGREFVGHTGNSVGAHSLFRVYPEQEAIAAFLVNCTNPGIEDQLKAVCRAL